MSISSYSGLYTADIKPESNQPGNLFVVAVAVACCALFSLPVLADEYHYNNILVGDRAAGMGGAYTAISDDPSGLYYNPAGIVYAQGNNISASANALHQTRTVYKNALGNGNNYVRDSYALLPNFFGIIQPLGKGKIGFSYAVPDSVIEDQNQTFYNLPNTTTSQYAINFNKSDSTYNFGPSYAMELTHEWSVGATLYAHYRRNEWRQNQLINKLGGTYEWVNQFYNNTEWGLKPIFGVMWSPTSKLSAGASLSTVKILRSDAEYQSICQGTIPGICDPAYTPGTAPFQVISKSTYMRVYPVTTTVGLAYFPSKALLISGDFSYYSRVQDNIFGDREATWNIALGTEYYLNEKWAVKAGFFTDRANTPKINNASSNALDHVDLYGVSLSASYFTRQSSITLGSTFRYGLGQAQILGNSATQDVITQTSTLFLSAAYFY